MELLDKRAVVMSKVNENIVDVVLIENGDAHRVPKLALVKTESSSHDGLWKNETDFDIDDDVQIEHDAMCLTFLQADSQRTPPDIALQLINFVGRVLCVYRGEVAVTFDEVTYEMLHPAALTKHSSLPIPAGATMEHNKAETKEFAIGAKVTVLPNLYEVMGIQQRVRWWCWEFTKHIGKEGVVTEHCARANGVIVKFDRFESFAVCREALQEANSSKKGETTKSVGGRKEPPFKYGDIVRLNIPPNVIDIVLKAAGIPASFSLIVSDSAEFLGYMNERQAVIDFGDKKLFVFDVTILVKSDGTSLRRTKERMKEDRAIKVGDEVVLGIGPEPFVKAILKNMKGGFANALEMSGEFIGYNKAGNAVIKYDNGTLYEIPDEFICSPRSEWKRKETQVYPWEIEKPAVVSSTESFILNSVNDVLERKSGSGQTLTWDSDITAINEETKRITIRFHGDMDDTNFAKTFSNRIATKKGIKMMELGESELKFAYESTFYQVIFKNSEGEVIESSKPSFPGLLNRQMSLTGNFMDSNVPGNLAPGRAGAAPASAPGSYNIPIPVGTQQVVLQLGAPVNGQNVSQSQNSVPVNPTVQDPNIVPNQIAVQPNPNPSNNNIYHFHRPEGVVINMPNSKVRQINVQGENNA